MNPSINNTLTRRKDELQAGKDGVFKMYCCGPTVYGPAHIGNFRTFVAQDVLRRVLELSGMKVLHVRNITDVDDKTIRESMKEGVSLKDFTRKWEDKFHEDCKKLNMLEPAVQPRATEHIAEQLEMVSKLVETGHAYVVPDGSVYFRISSFPGYGKLSGLDLENLATQNVNSAGEANSADEYERDSVSDFALWKGRKPEDGENFWKSPWGEGRPGWHIECSAMARKYLGDTFELHGGGVDLCFPHHENEIAQSFCSTGLTPAKYWYHSAHLMVEGRKMSKSLGNLYTIDDLVAKGYTPMQIRYELISGHYRQKLNFTFKGLDDAQSALSKLRTQTLLLLSGTGLGEGDFSKFVSPANAKFEGTAFEKAWTALCDDINVPKALGEIFSSLAELSKSKKVSESDLRALGALMYALGLDIFADEDAKVLLEAPPEITALAQERWDAKASRNFARSDELRKKISDLGWNVLDKKDGFDLEKA